MSIEIVLVIYGLLLTLAFVVSVCNSLSLRRFQREFSYELHGKADKKRLSASTARRKHVKADPVFQMFNGKKRIVGYECSQCGDTSVSKGGHTIIACERFQEEKKEEEQPTTMPDPMFAQPEEAHDPPMDRAPGAEDPGHDD